LAELFTYFGEMQSEADKDDLSDWMRAIEWYKQAIEVYPDLTDSYYKLAEAYEFLLDDKSIHDWDDDDVFDQTGIGTVDITERRIETYRQLTRVQPRDAKAFYRLGGAYIVSIDPLITLCQDYGNESTDEIEAMREWKHPVVHEVLKKAAGAFRSAVSIKPDYVSAYLELAVAYQAIGQLEESVQAFKQAIALGSTAHDRLAKAYHDLGRQKFSGGNYTEAIECYHSAIVTNSKYDEVYYDLGVAHDETGQYELAVLWYQRARSACGDPILRYNDDYFESATDVYAHVRDSYDYPDLYYRLGKTYHRIGQYEDAVEAYLVAIDHFIVIEEAYHEACYEIERNAVNRLVARRRAEQGDHEACNEIDRNAVPIKQEYLSCLLPEPPQQPEWWDNVFKYKESASRCEPL
ncbi:MAG: tetratricopeptide repeat protein, partial [Candidatus Poribacteria bacterium]|nr:tetratricopeptide repeat protein [Candidatus Poribacteria bacterium]